MKESLVPELGRHVARMYRVALRITGSDEAAQDVAQDACVKALRSVHQFDGRAAISTWLHRITVNCAHDHLRQVRRTERIRTDWDSDALADVAMVEAGPLERAEQKETYQLAMKLVGELPDDCRSAFILTQLDGYSYDETAAIENQARGTIASRVHRARQILTEQMNHHCLRGGQ